MSTKYFFRLLLLAAGFISSLYGQQVPDTTYVFPVLQPAYPSGKGPLIYIDRAHYNFHTKEEGFFAFSKLLEKDGYQVQSLSVPMKNVDVLKGCRILVISNALDSSNADNWALPTPSAFTREEINVIHHWVHNGGTLLLIADHMPFAGAAKDLAKAFGFEFLNGFAFTGEHSWPPSIFTRNDNTLRESPVTGKNNTPVEIDTIVTFTGSAFRIPSNGIPVLSFREKDWSLQPDTAWRFNSKTPKQALNGFHQGALLKYGKGRVAVFGEAAMFTAQIAGGKRLVGFNSPDAPHNAQFAINLVHWLDKDSSKH